MVAKIETKSGISRITRHISAWSFVVAAGTLSISTSSFAADKVVRINPTNGVISQMVIVPAGYDTIYLSGAGGGLPVPPGSPPGTAAPDPGNTETQAMRTLEKMKGTLEGMKMGMGDIVMLKCYLGPDKSTGKSDAVGWNNAFKKYFGTPEQPNKPSRTTITVSFGTNAANMIEVEAIAVRPHS